MGFGNGIWSKEEPTEDTFRSLRYNAKKNGYPDAKIYRWIDRQYGEPLIVTFWATERPKEAEQELVDGNWV